MTTDVFGTTPTVARDRWGRPLIIPPGGGKPVAYRRPSGFARPLVNNHTLNRWKLRQLAVGLAGRQDLTLAAAAHRDDRTKLEEIVDQALEAAGSSTAATTGTALHKFGERLDRGELTDLDEVPMEFRNDLRAYLQVTAGFEHILIEELLVNDEIKAAGTPDRVTLLPGDRFPKVLDLKTGSITYNIAEIGVQCAIYANSRRYNPATGERTRIDIDLNTAVIAHLPAGQGICTLLEIDIAEAMNGIRLAQEILAWRAVRRLARPFQTAETRTLLDRIESAATVAELGEIWKGARSEWTDELTTAASLRKAQLTHGGSK